MSMTEVLARYKIEQIKKHFPKLSVSADAQITENGALLLTLPAGNFAIQHCEENQGKETFAIAAYPVNSAIWSWGEQTVIEPGKDFELWALGLIARRSS